MEIEYVDKSMMKTLESEQLIRRKHGDIAKKLILRMSDLRVADNLSQITHLPPPRRHKLTGNWEGCWGIDLSKNQRLIIRPVGKFDPDDLATMTKIRVEGIEDYH